MDIETTKETVKERPRNFGNAAKLREVLELAWLFVSRSRLKAFMAGDDSMHQWAVELSSQIELALDAPARNCDKYPTRAEAEEAFFQSYFGPTENGFWEGAYADWLMAEAKTEEGAE